MSESCGKGNCEVCDVIGDTDTSDLLVILTFGNFAVTKWSFRILPLQNLITGISWKTFLRYWSSVRRICNSCKMFPTFRKTR